MGVLEEVGELHYDFPELKGEEKLRELIIYISDKCIDDETFGAVKLNKILYLSDFDHYAKYGIPITGLPYQSLINLYLQDCVASNRKLKMNWASP